MTRAPLLICMLVSLLAGCGDAKPPKVAAPPQASVSAQVDALFNLPAIIRQPPQVVAQLLGKPLGCEASKMGDKCHYLDKTEIVFIDNLSDWITVNADLPYSPDALPIMGFKPAPPSFQNENTMRWSGEQDTLVIQLTPGAAGRAAYAYIKVTSP